MNCCETDTRRPDCSSTTPEESGRSRGADRCPNCGGPGRKVGRITLKAMLRAESLKRLSPNPYCFCPTPHCFTVYFADGSMFEISDLRVPVWQKGHDPAGPICYCLEYSEDRIRMTIKDDGGSGVVEEIRQLVRDGRCACEVRNPQGSCCLGNVTQVVEKLRPVGTDREVNDGE